MDRKVSRKVFQRVKTEGFPEGVPEGLDGAQGRPQAGIKIPEGSRKVPGSLRLSIDQLPDFGPPQARTFDRVSRPFGSRIPEGGLEGCKILRRFPEGKT